MSCTTTIHTRMSAVTWRREGRGQYTPILEGGNDGHRHGMTSGNVDVTDGNAGEATVGRPRDKTGKACRDTRIECQNGYTVRN